MTVLPSNHYSGHNKAAEEEGDPELDRVECSVAYAPLGTTRQKSSKSASLNIPF